MELRHLRYFVAVAETGNVRAAALGLHVSQPSMSTQIRDLEREVGCPLFERSRQGMLLTQGGRAFLRGAKKTLADAEAAVLAARETARGVSGELVIGGLGELAASLWPATLGRFRKEFPGVEVSLLQFSREDLVAALLDGRVAVAILPGRMEAPRGFRRDRILSTPVLAVLPREHRLGRSTQPIALRDLAAEAWVHLRPAVQPGYVEWLRDLTREAGFVPKLGRAVDGRENLIGMVGAGYGVALAPEVVCRTLRMPSTVRLRPLTSATGPLELSAVWHERAASEAARGFVADLQAAAKALR